MARTQVLLEAKSALLHRLAFLSCLGVNCPCCTSSLLLHCHGLELRRFCIMADLDRVPVGFPQVSGACSNLSCWQSVWVLLVPLFNQELSAASLIAHLEIVRPLGGHLGLSRSLVIRILSRHRKLPLVFGCIIQLIASKSEVRLGRPDLVEDELLLLLSLLGRLRLFCRVQHCLEVILCRG